MYITDSILNLNSFRDTNQNAYNNSDSTSGSSDYISEDISNKLIDECKHKNKFSNKIFYQQHKVLLKNKIELNSNDCKLSLKRSTIEENTKDSLIIKVYFCLNCNELIIKFSNKKKFSILSKLNLNNNHFENPLRTYFNMLKKDKGKNKSFFNDDYNLKRKELINLIENLIINYNFSIDTFHLSIALLDEIFSKRMNLEKDPELITIGCFFLAGKEFF